MCQKVSTYQKKIGLKINELRVLKKISYQELAYRSDIEKSNLVRVINNAQNPTTKTLYNIAKGLNVPVIDLYSFCNDCPTCCIERSTS